jgi:hypothetical protein
VHAAAALGRRIGFCCVAAGTAARCRVQLTRRPGVLSRTPRVHIRAATEPRFRPLDEHRGSRRKRVPRLRCFSVAPSQPARRRTTSLAP